MEELIIGWTVIHVHTSVLAMHSIRTTEFKALQKVQTQKQLAKIETNLHVKKHEAICSNS